MDLIEQIPPSAPFYERFDNQVKTQVLSSGLTILHVPLHETPSFYIGATIAAGTRLETSKNLGISHFLEHMMFRGSRQYPDYAALAEAFENLGGEWNAATSHEHTEYWYSGIKHTAEAVIKLFADFISHPSLLEIETERQIILRELDGETNDLGHSTDLNGHMASLMWPGTSLDRPILGTRESLEKIQIDDLKSYRSQFYTPQRMVISVIGGREDLLATTLLEEFGQSKNDLKPHTNSVLPISYPPLSRYLGPKVKWVEHNDNEYEIKLSFICDHEWSVSAPSVHLITRILGDGFSSRLTRHLREKLGLVYDISASPNLGIDYGSIDIDATCSAEQLDDFLRELLLLIRELRNSGATPQELQRSKFRSLVDLELSLNHSEILGGRLGWSRLCRKPWSLSQHCEAIRTLTLDPLNQVISRIFCKENLGLVALGPDGSAIEDRMRESISRYF